MVSVELVLLTLLVFFVMAAVVMLGVTAVAAWVTARLATNALALVRPVVLGPTDIRDVELRVAGLRALDHVDAGVVTAVVPERRRGRRGLDRLSLTDGVRFDLALATPDDRTARLWVPFPNQLTGDSRLERVAAACGVFPDEISDAVGTELPLVRGADGRWRVAETRPRDYHTEFGDRATETEWA
ncbi:MULTISPECIES: hypothetical protein [Haloferax]|uniref:Uncharacterized protein n=1 Tax=Haloferax marinum TaxID=2666143 RepID=A0A6A8GB66_9EURY|nr:MULTISPECIES: hypothetical protein [Haloferax]KAB1198773.1 hypothetical protein Hfx1150_15080 [Haloferax sp. CBA1150]MRW97892.1 hypothetical protein [Haloferax marinum]